jgi:hypothetical protein
MPDEEFDMLGEEELSLLSRRFRRMYTNRKNARRSSGMCYRCGKHGHTIVEFPEAMEVKPEHKHRPRTDHKHRSRDDYKGKNKFERRLKDQNGEPERGEGEWEPIKFFSKEMETPTRRTRLPTHVFDSLPKLAKSTQPLKCYWT